MIENPDMRSQRTLRLLTIYHFKIGLSMVKFIFGILDPSFDGANK